MLTKMVRALVHWKQTPSLKHLDVWTSCPSWLQKQFKQKMWRICMLILTMASWHGDLLFFSLPVIFKDFDNYITVDWDHNVCRWIYVGSSTAKLVCYTRNVVVLHVRSSPSLDTSQICSWSSRVQILGHAWLPSASWGF